MLTVNQLFIVASSILIASGTCSVTFPRQSNALVIYPMSSAHVYGDVSGANRAGTAYSANGVSYVPGPFGDTTAMIPYSGNSNGLFYRSGFSVSSSFTVSFFFKVSSTGTGGIMGFSTSWDWDKVFSLTYEYPSTLSVWANGGLIGNFTIFHYNTWTFVSLVYDYPTRELSIYNRHGIVYAPSYQPDIKASNSFHNNGVQIGYTQSRSLYMTGNDAISCFSVYNVALAANEIVELHDACRAVLGSPPCGAPRQAAYASTPSPSTTMPKAGQFPWAASLAKDSKHVCSLSVLDPYWLVTAAVCFDKSADASNFKVNIGEHDLSVTESQQRTHSVSKIIFSPNSSSSGLIGELALVQLSDPIDLTNTFVNNICPFRGDTSQVNMLAQLNPFIFGWGIHGRTPLVSSTLPRYVSAKLPSDGQCQQQLGNQYNPKFHYCFLGSTPDFNVPCSGDEGSALMAPTDDFSSSKGIGPHLIELAVYVQRNSSCSGLSPGIFAKIHPYLPWITQQITCAVPSASHYPAACPQKISSPCACQ